MAGELMQLLYRALAKISCETPSSVRTNATESAHLGAKAFGEGRVVAAAYWMVMADLGGMQNLDSVIADYAAAWVAKGGPEKDDSTRLAECQQAFALSALRWFANRDKATARAWFEKSAGEGNAEAAAFLRRYG